jgi:hypothetical protein
MSHKYTFSSPPPQPPASTPTLPKDFEQKEQEANGVNFEQLSQGKLEREGGRGGWVRERSDCCIFDINNNL